MRIPSSYKLLGIVRTCQHESRVIEKWADGMSADQLLALLSPDQRKQFEAILADPKKAEALLENHTEDIHRSWWTNDGDDDDDGDRGSAAESSQEAGGRPRPLPLEKLLKLPQGSSSSDDHFELGFNLSAILWVISETGLFVNRLLLDHSELTRPFSKGWRTPCNITCTQTPPLEREHRAWRRSSRSWRRNRSLY